MRSTIATIILSVALCFTASANNGKGSGQDNSPSNPITNHGTDNGQGNGGVNNGNQGGNSNPGTPGNGGNGGQGGNGGNGGQGGKGGNGGSSSSSSSSSSSAKQSQNQGQAQGQQQSQSANNDGNKQSTTYNQNQVRQAPMAYAPDAFPSAPCRVSGSAGVSAPIGGISLGGSKLDTECDKRETARAFALIGQTDSACQILLTTKAAKAAGITSCVRPEPVAPVVPEVVTSAPVVEPEAPAPPAFVVIPVTVTLQNPPVTIPVLVQAPRKHKAKKAPVAPCKYTINVCVQ